MLSTTGLLAFSLATSALAGPTKTYKKRDTASDFVPPAPCPSCTSVNYVGKNNGSLPVQRDNIGKAFGRIIIIWMENTDFEDAQSTPSFQTMTEEGILLTNYYGLTHPSEPNYTGMCGGDFWGMADDQMHYVPEEIYSCVDILEDGLVSWATYQENLPYDGAIEYEFASANYVDPGEADYLYYMRKHNPPILFNRTALNTERQKRIRNFNDFAVDLNASAIPDWVFITPNMVNDAHDTGIDYGAAWLGWWLLPLLENEKFNSPDTLIVLTFDETETYSINNKLYTLLLGNAIPKSLRGTTDDTYYTHYSLLSTVENNWSLKGLGRGDMNSTMNNVFSWVADITGWKNNGLTSVGIPLTNLTETIPGPFNDYGLGTTWDNYIKPPFWNHTSPGGKGVIGWSN